MTSRPSLRRLLLAAVAAAAVALPATGATAATRPAQKLRVYAVPATVQFMNHADDRLRGMSTNPFKQDAEAVILNGNGNEKGGPYPGDDILYGFKIFSDEKLTKQVGTAMFTCYFQFAKRATCDSYFDLGKGGLLLASGQVPFGKPTFTLSVTGGTRSYFAALGQVTSAPAGGNAQRFDLKVTGQPE